MTNETSKRTVFAYSKVSTKSQTVLPSKVRERLKVGPGDRVRYIITDDGVLIERAGLVDDGDPLIAFTEWADEIDDQAYADL